MIRCFDAIQTEVAFVAKVPQQTNVIQELQQEEEKVDKCAIVQQLHFCVA